MSIWKHLITFVVIYIIYHEFIFVKGEKKYSLFYIYLDELCRIMYNYNIVGFFRQEGGVIMEYLLSFLAAVGARIISYFVCKWLDRRNDTDN